jgi:hypothetical protein
VYDSSQRSPDEVFICIFVAFLRNDLVEISRWAAEAKLCGPDVLKGLIEELHKEVSRILEVQSSPSWVDSLKLTISPQYDMMCNLFSEREKQRCVVTKNN